MLTEVTITKENKSIESGFCLKDIKPINIIIGKNGSGKTNLFEAIEAEYENKEDTIVVYIKANEVNLSEYAKTSADSSNLIKQLSSILKILNFDIKLDKKTQDIVDNVFGSTKANIKEFVDDIDLDPKLGNNIKYEWVARSLLTSIWAKDCGQDMKKLSDLAQGHQRIIIASLLKAFAEEKIKSKKESNIIILFEEPEIYLHPSLKSKMKEILWDMSEKFQVFISTHDPYFIFIEDGVKRYSLYKENGITKVHEDDKIKDIVDEIMHINLYSQISTEELGNLKHFTRKYYKKDCKVGKNLPLPTYIRHQIHHRGDNKSTIGFTEKPPNSGSNQNYYTRDELEQSISDMLEIISLRIKNKKQNGETL